jgi:sulfoxide reductase heme-binding subunit YedZ
MDPSSHLFWITSRAAGFTALLAASVAVGVGVESRPRGSLGIGRKVDLKNLHEALALTALAAIAVHGLSLLADSYLRPGLIGVTVPFAGPYRPLWTGLGIIGGYGLALLGLTYYVRQRIGTSRWRSLHRFTAIFWGAAVLHSLLGGSDSSQAWFLTIAILTLGPAAGLLVAWLAETAATRRLRPGGIALPTLDGSDRR